MSSEKTSVDFTILVAKFESKKTPFLDEVESSVRSCVISQGQHCVDVVEKIPRSDGTINTITLGVGDDGFISALISFMRRQRFRGHELDSALTPLVLSIVEKKLIAFYQGEQSEITAEFIRSIHHDEMLQTRLLEAVCEKVSKRKARSHVRKRVAHILAERLLQSFSFPDFSSNTASAMSHHVSHLTTATVESSAVTEAAHVIARAISSYMEMLVANLITDSTFKRMVVFMVQKIVVTLVSSVVVNALAAAIGGVSASAMLWILAPLMIAFLAKQIMDFPERMGRGIAEALRAELEKSFAENNQIILHGIFEDLVNGGKLAEALAKDNEIQRIVLELVDQNS